MKYIVVTGGVISGVGKGIVSASIGAIMKQCIDVTMIKIDPYFNVDAGNISPDEHGECFVLNDGTECDLDFGTYERFLDINLSGCHSITSGKIYKKVIENERNGKYLGQTVQVTPHITDEIIYSIECAAKTQIKNQETKLCIIELGGTIGDIEGLPFVEALRQLSLRDENQVCFVHVALAVSNGSKDTKDIKTKPIQRSVSDLRSLGIIPNIILVRTNGVIADNKTIKKISVHCGVHEKRVLCNPQLENIYMVPEYIRMQGIDDIICKDLEIERSCPIINPFLNYKNEKKYKVNIGVVGKYNMSVLSDNYMSLSHALEHTCYYLNVDYKITWMENFDKDSTLTKECDCFIIPGGFGSRGIDEKIKAIKYCYENNIPILGICLGMQLMVCFYYEKMTGNKCYSEEWKNLISDDEYADKIIYNIDGSMRSGKYECTIYNSKTRSMYNSFCVEERHRHKYYVTNDIASLLNHSDLKIVSISEDGFIEIVESLDNIFFIGVQFHPEFKSRIQKPHPIFNGLIESVLYKKKF